MQQPLRGYGEVAGRTLEARPSVAFIVVCIFTKLNLFIYLFWYYTANLVLRETQGLL